MRKIIRNAATRTSKAIFVSFLGFGIFIYVHLDGGNWTVMAMSAFRVSP